MLARPVQLTRPTYRTTHPLRRHARSLQIFSVPRWPAAQSIRIPLKNTVQQTSGKTRRRTHNSNIDRVESHSDTIVVQDAVAVGGTDVGEGVKGKGKHKDDNRDAKRHKVAGREFGD
jgi:hypothetical protein